MSRVGRLTTTAAEALQLLTPWQLLTCCTVVKDISFAMLDSCLAMISLRVEISLACRLRALETTSCTFCIFGRKARWGEDKWGEGQARARGFDSIQRRRSFLSFDG